jgi:hypothetical protein
LEFEPVRRVLRLQPLSEAHRKPRSARKILEVARTAVLTANDKSCHQGTQTEDPEQR